MNEAYCAMESYIFWSHGPLLDDRCCWNDIQRDGLVEANF